MSKQKNRSTILSVIFILLVLSLLLESRIYFKEFKVPGDAYEYKYNDTEYQVIEGKYSACIIGSEETLFVVKKEQKWIIPFNENIQAKHIQLNDDEIIYVQQCNNLDDYYITVYSYGTDVNVHDNMDSNFLVINEEYYCTCVTNLDGEYRIYVDDKEMILNNQ